MEARILLKVDVTFLLIVLIFQIIKKSFSI
jgi:hypothetical protein